MNRRRFFQTLVSLPALLPKIAAGYPQHDPPATFPILHTQLAGFQYHHGEFVWDRLRNDDELTLRRQPGNPHDRRAVEVYWRDHKLGYIPRADNAVIAQLLDRQAPLQSRITQLGVNDNSWRYIHLQVNLAV